MIWLGDFNRHCPEWDEERNTHLFTRSNPNNIQLLINATTKYDLQMALPKYIPMLTIMCRNLTRTNNVFISSDPIGHLAEHWKINQKSLTTSLLIPSSKSLYRTQYQPLCSTSDKLIVHSPSSSQLARHVTIPALLVSLQG